MNFQLHHIDNAGGVVTKANKIQNYFYLKCLYFTFRYHGFYCQFE